MSLGYTDPDWSELHWAAWEGRESDLALLLANGADINARDARGRTAFVVAADAVRTIPWLSDQPRPFFSQRHEDAARFLLRHGADIHRRDKGGNTPLMAVVFGQSQALTRDLLRAGVDVHDRRKDGYNALTCAAGGDNPFIVSLLLEAGAHVEARDSRGETALFYAVLCGKREIIPVLLDAGADAAATNNKGKTAADTIRRSCRLSAGQELGYPEIVQMLDALVAQKRNGNIL